MNAFHYRNGTLFCEDLDLSAIVERVGTPAYVYSAATLRDHVRRLKEAFSPLQPQVRFSVKSLNNIHLLKVIAAEGAGMDVVSGGELYLTQLAGIPGNSVVFAGVGKTAQELDFALQVGVGWINVESEQECALLVERARLAGVRPKVALRINPDVYDATTPDKTLTGRKDTKFGVGIDKALTFFERFAAIPEISLCGLHFHLGSPVSSSTPYEQAIDKCLDLIESLRHRRITLSNINIGGGYMAHYGDEALSLNFTDYASSIVPRLMDFVQTGGEITLEPGRSICANAGVLLCTVLYTKESGGRNFLIVDAGMSDMVRATLYGAEHYLWPMRSDQPPPVRRLDAKQPDLLSYDVVGPICESGDFLALDRQLPALEQGDRLALFSVGAYGMVMSSQYNARPRPPEVLVDRDHATLVRRRETYEDLVKDLLPGTPLL